MRKGVVRGWGWSGVTDFFGESPLMETRPRGVPGWLGMVTSRCTHAAVPAAAKQGELFSQVVFFDFSVEGALADFQDFRGLLAVAVDHLERVADQLLLGLLDADAHQV